MTRGDRASCWVQPCSRSPFGQCPDLTIAQAVVDIGEQLAGRGDHADVAFPRSDDAGAVGGEFGARAGALAGLDRCPTHQGGALFSDRTTADGGIRLTMAWGKPSPAGQLFRTVEPVNVTDLGDKDGTKVGPIPLICWITRYPR